MIKTILDNQAAYYPQAPVSGGTLRMNDVINEINRAEAFWAAIVKSHNKIEKTTNDCHINENINPKNQGI